jgi:hypothetical protein
MLDVMLNIILLHYYLVLTSQPRKPARVFITLEARKNPGYRWSRDSQKIDCLRGGRESIILHASTSALYTSIARSECSVPINFENHIFVKILAKFDFCLLFNGKKRLNRFL